MHSMSFKSHGCSSESISLLHHHNGSPPSGLSSFFFLLFMHTATSATVDSPSVCRVVIGVPGETSSPFHPESDDVTGIGREEALESFYPNSLTEYDDGGFLCMCSDVYGHSSDSSPSLPVFSSYNVAFFLGVTAPHQQRQWRR